MRPSPPVRQRSGARAARDRSSRGWRGSTTCRTRGRAPPARAARGETPAGKVTKAVIPFIHLAADKLAELGKKVPEKSLSSPIRPTCYGLQLPPSSEAQVAAPP
jgi:hypothetical protein